MRRMLRRRATLVLLAFQVVSSTRVFADDAMQVPEKFEVGLVAGYKEARVLGIYLLSPVFFAKLRGGAEVSFSSYDFYTDEGKIEERDSDAFSLSLLSRSHIAKSFYWSTQVALGASIVRGRKVSDDSAVSKKATIPFTEFESSIGSWSIPENYQPGDWLPNAEAGFSFRHNVRGEEVFLIEGQTPLAAGSVGAFVRLGIGF